MAKHALLTAIDQHLKDQAPEHVLAECGQDDAAMLAAASGVTGGGDALTYRGVVILVTEASLWRVAWAGGAPVDTLEAYDA